MKRKEIIQLIVAVVVLVAAGMLIYSQLVPAKKAAAQSGPTVEVITPISPNFDSVSQSLLTDTTKNRDYYQAPDLKSGLGNSQPFGPLQ